MINGPDPGPSGLVNLQLQLVNSVRKAHIMHNEADRKDGWTLSGIVEWAQLEKIYLRGVTRRMESESE